MGESKYVFHTNDQNFENEVLKHPGPVLVDFWAEWCGPCKALGPVLDDLAGEYSNKLKVVKMNVDESPGTPQRYSIRSIPTLIFFKDGKVVEQLVGNQPRNSIKGVIEKVLN